MNCNDLAPHLVDFLAGELESSAVEHIEAHLRDCPTCAAEVEGLRGVVAMLDETRLAPSAVAALSRGVRLAETPRGRLLSRLVAPLRYAAAIVIAFSGGYFARGGTASPQSPSLSSSVEREPSRWNLEAISPKVAERFEAASIAFPKASTFSRSLLAFSRQ